MASIAMIGGDQRMVFAKQGLEAYGFSVSCWGLGEADTHPTWQETVENAECVLLPIPASEDGVRVRSPMHEAQGLRFSVLLEGLPIGIPIYGGRLPQIWVERAMEKGHSVWDYNASEAFQMRNAGPTAEGAILLAAQALMTTVNGMKATVLGYGRIASLLAEKLRLLGADVTVYARKERDLCHARLRGLRAIPLVADGESDALKGMNAQIVFNTVPQQIVTADLLKTWDRGCVLMELASAPGGFDLAAVESLGFTRIHGAALPGKLFPKRAGEILAETVAEEMNRSKDY